jgi:hypothetical protein
MNIAIPDGYSRAQLLDCLDREIRLRERAYPRWVERGKMTAPKALEEVLLMRAVRATIAQLPAPPAVQPELFGGRP